MLDGGMNGEGERGFGFGEYGGWREVWEWIERDLLLFVGMSGLMDNEGMDVAHRRGRRES